MILCLEGGESGFACIIWLPLIGQVPLEPEAEPSGKPGGYLLCECVHTYPSTPDKSFIPDSVYSQGWISTKR